MPKIFIGGYLGSGKGVIENYISYKDYYLNGYTLITNVETHYPTFDEILKGLPDDRNMGEYQLLVNNGSIVNDELAVETPQIINLDEVFEQMLDLAIKGKPFPSEWGNKIDLLGDEWYLYNEARGSTRLANTLLSYLWFQTRKRHTTVIISGPRMKYNDPRIRENVDQAIKCFKHHFITNEQCFDSECELPHWFEYDIIDLINSRGSNLQIDDWDIIQKIFKLYNTEQLLAMPSLLTEEDVQEEFADG